MVDAARGAGSLGDSDAGGFLSVQGHPDQTSPVLRGKFVRAMMLCEPPPPPPTDVEHHAARRRRRARRRAIRFSAHLTAGASCNGCHSVMDPIGLAFENFDAMGQYRTTDNGAAPSTSPARSSGATTRRCRVRSSASPSSHEARGQRPGQRLHGDAVVPLRVRPLRGRRGRLLARARCRTLSRRRAAISSSWSWP